MEFMPVYVEYGVEMQCAAKIALFKSAYRFRQFNTYYGIAVIEKG